MREHIASIMGLLEDAVVYLLGLAGRVIELNQHTNVISLIKTVVS